MEMKSLERSSIYDPNVLLLVATDGKARHSRQLTNAPRRCWSYRSCCPSFDVSAEPSLTRPRRPGKPGS